MSDIKQTITEKFEIPAILQKQLESTGYSALGYILSPHIEKINKKIFSNRELNEKSYNGLKNVVSTIKKMVESNGSNTKLTYTDVLIPEYFSPTDVKKIMHKCKVTIEKSGDDIYVDSDEKKDKIFPNLVISKDYAGWDLKQLNVFWKRIDDSFQKFKREFDEKLITIENIKNKLESWKTLDKARKPKTKPIENVVLVYEKKTPDGIEYEHYFRAMSSKKLDTNKYANFFSSGGGSNDKPIIIQTVYMDQFPTDSMLYSIEYFLKITDSFISTSRHEGRHLMQFSGNTNKNLKGNFYGGPKKALRHQFNPDIRGINPHGEAGPTAKFKDTEDDWNRVLHPHRDVEFKTNLYNYKEDIENFLNKNLPRDRWKEGFKDLIRYIAGFYNVGGWNNKYPQGTYGLQRSIALNHLKELYKHDRPKFNQLVKELYKLIFNG